MPLSYVPLHIDVSVLSNLQEITYNSSVQTQDVVWKTWMIKTDGKRVREIHASSDDDGSKQLHIITWAAEVLSLYRYCALL